MGLATTVKTLRVTPSEYADPYNEWQPWKRYCFDEAIVRLGITVENHAYKEAMRKAEEERSIGDQPDNEIEVGLDGNYMLAGSFGGKVGEYNDELAQAYIAAGGVLPGYDPRGKKAGSKWRRLGLKPMGG